MEEPNCKITDAEKSGLPLHNKEAAPADPPAPAESLPAGMPPAGMPPAGMPPAGTPPAGMPDAGEGEPSVPPEAPAGGEAPFDDGCIAAFPADLTREEYIDFNVVVSQTTGLLRFRKGQMILFGVLGAMSLCMVILDIVTLGSLDPVLVLLILFLVAAAGILFFGIPRYVRSTAAKAYDQSILNGYSYYGEIRAYPDRVEKQGKNTVVIPFAQNAAYIENERMMILLSPGTPSIVLPARCMTPAAAEGIRRAVLPGIPAPRQKLAARLIPLAQAPLSPPEQAAEEEEEIERLAVDVEYTKEEFVKIVTDTSRHAFTKMLPLYCGMSLLAGLMFGLMNGPVIGALSFLLIIGLLYALNIGPARGRASRSFAMMPEGANHLRISFSDQGLTVRSERPGESMRLVWKAVERAVEQPDCVEFYTATTFLRIPKRCIPALEELKTLVDAHVRPKKPKR